MIYLRRLRKALLRAYNIVTAYTLEPDVEIATQMAVKPVCDSRRPNGLIPRIEIYEALPRWSLSADMPIPPAYQCAIAFAEGLTKCRNTLQTPKSQGPSELEMSPKFRTSTKPHLTRPYYFTDRSLTDGTFYFFRWKQGVKHALPSHPSLSGVSHSAQRSQNSSSQTWPQVKSFFQLQDLALGVIPVTRLYWWVSIVSMSYRKKSYKTKLRTTRTLILWRQFSSKDIMKGNRHDEKGR